MPIQSIVNQPTSNLLLSAYAPIIIEASALQSTPTAERYIPPVVYCDIYIDGIYYKSMYATQTTNVPTPSINPVFKFDIQDAIQEVLAKKVPEYMQTSITKVSGPVVSVYCKLRASSTNSDGFTILEGPVPTQATFKIPPISGGGTQTNSFWVANVALQHMDNPNLATHLSNFKNKVWSADAYPLTHRPNGYKLTKADSDVFPILYLGSKALRCIRINYKKRGDTSYQTVNNCPILPPSGTPEMILKAFSLVSPIPVTYPYFGYELAIQCVDFDKAIFATSGTVEYSFDGTTWNVVEDFELLSVDELLRIKYTFQNSSTEAHYVRVNTGVSTIAILEFYYSRDYSPLFNAINITSNSFQISHAFSAGVTWDLSIDGGVTYAQTGLTASTYTVNGLAAATAYNVVRRMHSINGVVQALPIQTITTL